MHKFYWHLGTNAICFKSPSKSCSHILDTNICFSRWIMHWNKSWPKAAFTHRNRYCLRHFIEILHVIQYQNVKGSGKEQEKKKKQTNSGHELPQDCNLCEFINLMDH